MMKLGTLLTAVVAVIALAIPAGAAATDSPPTITSQFSPNLIAIGGTATLAVTITNPNSSVITGVGFSETLPSGVVIDNPNGESGTCGTNGVVTAVTGTRAISLSGGTVQAVTNCVVSVNVTSSAPGVYSNDTGPVTSIEGGSSAHGDTESLTVVGEPTIAPTSPVNNATFNFGQKVLASYTCTEAANGPGITDCSAVDGLGYAIASGAPLVTNVAGPNTLTISATSADGLVATNTLSYTVRPNNEFKVTDVKPAKNGVVRFWVHMPGGGKLTAAEVASSKHAHNVEFATWSEHLSGAKTFRVALRPGERGAALIKSHGRPVTLKLTLTFTPTGGLTRKETVKGIAIPS